MMLISIPISSYCCPINQLFPLHITQCIQLFIHIYINIFLTNCISFRTLFTNHMHFLPVLSIHVQQTSLSRKVIQLTVYFVCSAVHGLLMADTTHSCNITALCLPELTVNTFINLSTRGESPRDTDMGKYLQTDNKKSQKPGDKPQTLCTLPSVSAVESSTIPIRCTSHNKTS